ncbi:amino acid ABC transporter permease [Gulosibacter sp. 10]|uniref:amino acid ABC transporter permease n=1 Tax=Gulosibacter sp. 10 TaxID=1255570 RepID=UPI00097F509D|nr:amino acid ABC transporter permease [Gulosibacter sp. 10]SJM67778.1 putative ABC transporter permease protein [Gulosibacter sp. 10]
MSEIFGFLFTGLVTTVVITLSAFLVGAILGVPIALARLSKFAVLRWLGTTYVEIARGIPPIAWMLIFYFGLSRFVQMPPLLAACVALGIVAAAYMAEYYRAGIRSVAKGQWEAAQALGLGGNDTFWRIIAPQGVGVALPPSATFLIGLLKDSAVASVIGVADIAFQALVLTQQGNPGLPIFLSAGLVYLLLGIPLAILARTVEQAIRSRIAV